MIRYVVHPGNVRSANDGETHYVGASRLAELYGLAPGTWLVFRDGVPVDDLIHLFPREDGNYRGPLEEL